MSNVPVAYIDIHVFAHATEDSNKVVQATQRILPLYYIEEVKFKRCQLKGHYGNPIDFFETKIKDKAIVKSVVENLASNLSKTDKETLQREIELHVDNGKLYIRLDKQAAYQGKYMFGSVDPIHIRIRFKKGKLEDVVKTCQELRLFP